MSTLIFYEHEFVDVQYVKKNYFIGFEKKTHVKSMYD